MTQIALIQRALAAAGFSPGLIDNAWGPVTAAALRRWEAASGLPINGVLDPLDIGILLPNQKAVAPIVWLDEAARLLGLQEGVGQANNQTILDWADDLDLHYPSDATAWCGLFVAHVIRTALPDEALPTNPLGARNWSKFGRSCAPQVGAIGVFWRGSPNGWQGHVGLLIAESKTAYQVRGGNQSDSVSDAWLSKDRLLDARWPFTAGDPLGRPLPSKASAKLSSNEG